MKKTTLFLAIILIAFRSFGQQFEEPKLSVTDFEKVKLHVGADFALQYQAIDHHASTAKLIELGSNFNLPTANLNLNAMLAPGIKVNLETYLSARHHNEAWVKGGYLLIDNLPFLKAADPIMKYLTIKAGVFQPNVGDQIFRRSDNGNVINNPFVGNYVMDDFTTNTGIEVYFRKNGLLILGGVNSGNLKPALGGTEGSGTSKEYVGYDLVDELAINWKLSYDKQVTEDLRLRASLSGYHVGDTHSTTIHSGDRTGSRYYLVMNTQNDGTTEFDVTKNHMSGNFYPGSGTKDNTLVANIFAKYKWFEIFGTYEQAKGERTNFTTFAKTEYDFAQLAIEGIARFGKQDQWFVGARYTVVTDDKAVATSRIDQAKNLKVDRTQLAAGWFMTKNVVTKIEYVNQNYSNFATYGEDAGFKGVMVEAAISF